MVNRIWIFTLSLLIGGGVSFGGDSSALDKGSGGGDNSLVGLELNPVALAAYCAGPQNALGIFLGLCPEPQETSEGSEGETQVGEPSNSE